MFTSIESSLSSFTGVSRAVNIRLIAHHHTLFRLLHYLYKRPARVLDFAELVSVASDDEPDLFCVEIELILVLVVAGSILCVSRSTTGNAVVAKSTVETVSSIVASSPLP